MAVDRPPRPIVTDAPGLTWRASRHGWEARWKPRSDLVKRGYPATINRLWRGAALTDGDRAWIQDRCNFMQREMLLWGQGGIKPLAVFDSTMRGLIACYQSDPDSTYRKLRFKSREWYDNMCARIVAAHGDTLMADIKARTLLRWHESWSGAGKVAMGHAMVGMLRILFGFGATILEDEHCERICGVLHKMRFPMAKARAERITAEQATAIRKAAHDMGLHSIALAQAIQFECILRQKDVIGEWVPISEPGLSTITDGNMKWLRGIQWQEIDSNLILRHITSKRQKEIVINLRLAPMVMEELGRLREIPKVGPVIASEAHGRPYAAHEFRRGWRKAARIAGVPDEVYNMDSRAGAISEATDAGAELEHVRQAATHSDISMTQRYSRGGEEKTANVMKIRAKHRANAIATKRDQGDPESTG